MIITAHRHLYITGFMGTGKSAAGAVVARTLGLPFYDLDIVVEGLTGHTIPGIFAAEGEEAFRKYEWRALRSIVGASASVIALGGGAPTVLPIRSLIAESGHTVLLTADVATIWSRLQNDRSRPLLLDDSGDGPGSLEDFKKRVVPLLESRDDFYKMTADGIIDTSNLDTKTIAQKIVAWWHEQTR